MKYDIYKVKLLLFRLVVEMSSYVAPCVQVSSSYLIPKCNTLCVCVCVCVCHHHHHVHEGLGVFPVP